MCNRFTSPLADQPCHFLRLPKEVRWMIYENLKPKNHHHRLQEPARVVTIKNKYRNEQLELAAERPSRFTLVVRTMEAVRLLPTCQKIYWDVSELFQRELNELRYSPARLLLNLPALPYSDDDDVSALETLRYFFPFIKKLTEPDINLDAFPQAKTDPKVRSWLLQVQSIRTFVPKSMDKTSPGRCEGTQADWTGCYLELRAKMKVHNHGVACPHRVLHEFRRITSFRMHCPLYDYKRELVSMRTQPPPVSPYQTHLQLRATRPDMVKEGHQPLEFHLDHIAQSDWDRQWEEHEQQAADRVEPY